MIPLMGMLIMIGVIALVTVKRTTIEVHAFTTEGAVRVYTTSIWTRAWTEGNYRVVYGSLVKMVQRHIRLDDGWLRGVDFGIWDGTLDKDGNKHYEFIVRYEDALSNNKFINS